LQHQAAALAAASTAAGRPAGAAPEKSAVPVALL